jgi:hypothetical protein
MRDKPIFGPIVRMRRPGRGLEECRRRGPGGWVDRRRNRQGESAAGEAPADGVGERDQAAPGQDGAVVDVVDTAAAPSWLVAMASVASIRSVAKTRPRSPLPRPIAGLAVTRARMRGRAAM